MHRHACGVGHYFECAADCECFCGLPMNGHDYSECPIDIRLCPEHENEHDRPAPEPGFVEIDFSSVKPRTVLPHCECGCSKIEPGEGVGWCLHCDHVYVKYDPELEDHHFAYNCPEAPQAVKESARVRLANRGHKLSSRGTETPRSSASSHSFQRQPAENKYN
jgi:hypothetical protein